MDKLRFQTKNLDISCSVDIAICRNYIVNFLFLIGYSKCVHNQKNKSDASDSLLMRVLSELLMLCKRDVFVIVFSNNIFDEIASSKPIFHARLNNLR
jgi:hypothetical protein